LRPSPARADQRRGRGRGHERGAVLFAVLGLLATLALVQGTMLIAAQTALRRAEAFEARLVLQAGTEAILWSVVHDLADAHQSARPPRVALNHSFAEVRANVGVEDEAGKVDVNRSGASFITQALSTGGCDQRSCEGLAAAIIAWRSRLPDGQGRFRIVEDLAAVPGMPPGLLARAAPALTVYSGLERPRSDVAPESLREAMTPGQSERPSSVGTGSGIYRIHIRARSSGGSLPLTAVVRVSAPPAILVWR